MYNKEKYKLIFRDFGYLLSGSVSAPLEATFIDILSVPGFAGSEAGRPHLPLLRENLQKQVIIVNVYCLHMNYYAGPRD